MRILIIDKDIPFSKHVKKVLEGFKLNDLTVCHSANEGISLLKRYDFSIVLLDLLESGIEESMSVVNFIKEQVHIPFVFISSQVGQKIIDRIVGVQPSGYLVKPFLPVNLYITINMAVQRFQELEKRSIVIQDKGSDLYFAPMDIIWAQSMGNYLEIKTREKIYRVRYTMQKFEELLDASTFIRIHRSYIVNLQYVNEIKREYIVVQRDKLPISRGMKDKINRLVYA